MPEAVTCTMMALQRGGNHVRAGVPRVSGHGGDRLGRAVSACLPGGSSAEGLQGGTHRRRKPLPETQRQCTETRLRWLADLWRHPCFRRIYNVMHMEQSSSHFRECCPCFSHVHNTLCHVMTFHVAFTAWMLHLSRTHIIHTHYCTVIFYVQRTSTDSYIYHKHI